MGFQNPLAYSALFVAAARAAESERPDRLFEDEFASLLAGDLGHQILHAAKDRGIRTDLAADYIAIRTRFIDDALWQTFAAGIHQTVILAAGLDARAFRLHWPEGTTCFEIDARSHGIQGERSRDSCLDPEVQSDCCSH
jgi:methyltransferase (TIGR00027 family)